MLIYQTVEKKVTLGLEETSDKCSVVAIRQNNRLVALFPIESVYDEIVNMLKSISQTTSPGVARRSYEARNICRLTSEYIRVKIDCSKIELTGDPQ